MAAKQLYDTSSDVLFTERRNFYIQPDTYSKLWVAAKPFTTMLSGRQATGGVIKTTEKDFKLFEHRATWKNTYFYANASTNWTTSGARGNVVTDLNIDNITGLPSTPDASYYDYICEIYASDNTTYKGMAQITAASATKITAKSLGNPRAADGIALALADNDIWQVVTKAAGELSSANEANSDELAVVYNSIQHFRVPVEVSYDLYNAQLRGASNEAKRLVDLKMQETMMLVENALLKGYRAGGTGSVDLASDNVTTTDSLSYIYTNQAGLNTRTTMGIIPAIYRYGTSSEAASNQNIFLRSSANYSYSQFVDDMGKIMQYKLFSGQLVVHAGPGFVGTISKFCAKDGAWASSGLIEFDKSPVPSEFGYDIRMLHTPHGSLKIVTNPNMDKQYRNTAVIVTPDNLDMVEYDAQIGAGGTGLQLFTDIKKDNGYKGWKSEWEHQVGLGIRLIETHSLIVLS